MSEGDQYIGRKPCDQLGCFEWALIGSEFCLKHGVVVPPFLKLAPESEKLGVPELLEGMAKTFRERNAIYGDNWNMVGRLMVVMFPDGVKLRTVEDYDVWHLFELMIVKLSRFAVAKLSHQDSIHDLAVYATMVESIIQLHKDKGKRHDI